jgi:uncharacterized membrane protein YjgN (DUF898 family)
VVRLEFGGNVVEVVWWALVILVATLLLILPGAWALAAACRWFCRNLHFSDGTTAEFTGKGNDIFGWWLLMMVSGGGHYGIRVRIPIHPLYLENVWDLAIFLVSAYAGLQILRWFVRNVRRTSGERFEFTGAFWEWVGRQILNALMLVTIIGWAWTVAAMYRWMAQSTRAKDAALQFHGEAVEILWRVVAAILLCCLILPIPWVWLWWTRWIVGNVTIEGVIEE